MKEQNEELFLLSLASRITEEKAKELYSKQVLSPEQYIKLCEFMKIDQVDNNCQIKELVESIKGYELEQEAKEQERMATAADNAQKRKLKLENQKQSLEAAATLTPEKKAKAKKVGIVSTIGLVVLLITGFGLNWAFTNIIGFTDVDLADYVVVYYDTSSQYATPDLYGNWQFYSEGGYYTDTIESLVENGIYTEDEATALMPDEMATEVEPIVYNYELSTTNSLVNGDQFEATISYDQDLAKELKLNVINNKFAFTMHGLREPVEASDITDEMLSQIEFTNEDAIGYAMDDEWRPENYNYEVESTHYFLKKDPTYSDVDDTYYLEKVAVIKKTEIDDNENVEYISEGKEMYVLKSDTDIKVENESYGTDYAITYRGDLGQVLEDYEDDEYEYEEVGGDL